jgi:hypothetical protein
VKEPTFTLDEMLQALRNVGVDVKCGACIERAFTGATGHTHSCGLGDEVVMFYTPPEG